MTYTNPKQERKKVDLCTCCGKPESAHDPHIFMPVTIPATCICHPKEWIDYSNIPAVCERYDEDGIFGGCKTCEHERGCHAADAEGTKP